MEIEALAVVGPTACGKTRRAVELAERFQGEIISADSRQVYRGMSIGTGKDLDEYGDIPYHLIDIADAGTKYNLHRYLNDFKRAFADIRRRGKLPVICGGSGMYVENALCGVVTPEVPENKQLRADLEGKSLEELTLILSQYKNLHNNTDVDTAKRAIRAIEIAQYYSSHPQEASEADRSECKPVNALVIGLDIPRELRRERISKRLRSRLEEGMVDEVRKLLDSGISAESLIYYGLEYKFVTLYLIGKIGYEDMVKSLEIAIHQFAKRQMTWFRGMQSRRGHDILWVPYNIPKDELYSIVEEKLLDFAQVNI